jgi:serine/threonine protein kinase
MQPTYTPKLMSLYNRSDATVGMPPDDSELRAGMTLKNRFVLEQILGQGGMGAIFKARDLRKEEMNDRKIYVAIKVLHPKYRKNNSLIKALQREARKSQELAHPNIVNVHDFDRDGRHVFMVMEYLEGQTLKKLIDAGGIAALSLQQRWHLIESIAYALAYAHQKKVIHYDIKPANIYICNDHHVKILDFGIAKAMRAPAEENYTVFDQFSPDALTPAYATVEMLRWEAPDVRDDVYALGCVGYEILTGKHPFNKVPALQALERGLKPKPIKGLSKARWQVLKAALQLERSHRLPGVEAFLGTGSDGGKGSVKSALSWIAATTVVVVTVLTGVFGLWKPPTGPDKIEPAAGRGPTITRPTLSPEQQAKVDRLMELAELHASIGRVVEPLGSSALDAYASVLEIDPGLPEARQGIANAIATCRTDVETLMVKGELEVADDVVQHCLMVKPDDPVLRQLDANLQGMVGSVADQNGVLTAD